ncbi:MAG: carbohydrate ABC transporter substrate-binding protein [Mesorhizobium sp.]|nr:MAG: carbohydrate ABC transporter substrate-binding protein [Mesorhizobium sp.]
MTTKLLTALLLGTSILGSAGMAYAEDVTLNIESWRGDDLAIWKDKLIPAFEAKNPGIKVVFAPSAPTEYDAAMDQLGIKVPTTNEEFYAALDKIKADGTYIPMAMGTKDLWEAATMGYQNIGPNYWKGEEGRTALIKGEQKLTDPQWVAPFAELAKWKPYLGDGFEAQTYPDSQNLFTLGRAAIYPAGSWEIGLFNTQAQFKMGAFPPPVQKAGDTCYISDHTDIGMGLNAASKNADAAKTFLTWVASPDFATIYANALPGFFSLNKTPVKMEDPLAQEFVSWRDKCKSTIRSTYQILGRGTPNLENETWVESANVINGTDTPEAAAKKLQDGLDSWYKPAK